MKISANLPAILVVGVLVLGVGMMVWRVVAPSTDEAIVRLTIPQLSAEAQAGKQAFDANCGQCHGDNGVGSDRGPPLVHDIYNPGHHGDQAFYAAITKGVRRHHWLFGDMEPQPGVTPEEIAAIVRYVREMQEANGILRKPHIM